MGALTHCDTHPRELAGWACGSCGRRLCLSCASSRRMGGDFVVACRHCGGFGSPILVSRAKQTYAQTLPTALVYPFSRNGLLTMAACGAVFSILLFASVFGAAIATASWASYLFVVIRSTADGQQDVPESEDFANVFDLFVALLKAGLAMLLSILPLLLYTFEIKPAIGLNTLPLYDPFSYITAAVGFAWTPMALMFAAMNSRFVSIVHPVLAVHYIRRIGFDFVLASLVFWGCALGWLILSGTGELFVRVLPIPLLPRMFAQAVALYPGLVGARALGQLMFVRGEQLGFGRPYEHREPALGALMPPEEEPAPANTTLPVEPIELTMDESSSLTAKAPHVAQRPPPALVPDDAATDEEIRIWADLKQFEAVAGAYRERRGNVAILTADELIEVARAALAQDDAQTASHAFKRVGYDHPESAHAPEALLQSATLLRDQLNRRDEAERLFNHLLRAYPESPEATEVAGQLLIEEAS